MSLQSEAPDIEARADALQFVKEGFSWPAFFVPALWLIYCRMWIELVLFVVIFGALQWVFGVDKPGQDLLGWVMIGLFALFAFEANDLRGAALERRGYRLIGVAEGRSRTRSRALLLPHLAAAARKAGADRAAPARAERDSEQRRRPAHAGEGDEVIGLFPQA